jgi:ribosomal protein S18 acetylase RimI-like enzyme
LVLFRQRGVATRLVEKLEGVARRLGASEIWVLTAEDNTPAMRLYEKTGFQRERMNDVFWRLDLGANGTSRPAKREA